MSIVDSYRVPKETSTAEVEVLTGFQLLEDHLKHSIARPELIDSLINIADLNAEGPDDRNVGSLDHIQSGATVPLTLGELREFLSIYMLEDQAFRVDTEKDDPLVTVVRWFGSW